MTANFDPIAAMARLLTGVLRQTGAGHSLSPAVSVPAGKLYLGLGLDRGADLATVRAALGKALRPSGATVTYDLTDPAKRHVITTALDDYAAKERAMATDKHGHEVRDRWAALADRMRQQAEAAGNG